jgi:hypothetical protein
MTLQAPFPWFGGKSRVAHEVWRRFGAVRNFVEPFLGSAAMLLARPQPFDGTETVNDYDGMVVNFWRAVAAKPDEVAFHADHPVFENDLHARHAWLVGQKESLQSRLEGDPDFFDTKIAGWWCWGTCCWIAGGFCSGRGPWQVQEVDGVRQLVHLGNAGQGVTRQRVHLGDAGRGVNRQLVHLGSAGQGDEPQTGIYGWMQALADRLARVRVCCGDWSRVCGDTPTVKRGLTAVFLDPPYSGEAGRDNDIYAKEDLTIAHDVRQWCLERGGDKLLRIALCGYEGEHEALEAAGWAVLAWKTKGGYGSQGSQGSLNAKRERVWFSPQCLAGKRKQEVLF